MSSNRKEKTKNIIFVKPFIIPHDFIPQCVKCHTKLKFRKPTKEEQELHRIFYHEKYDCNICTNEDVWGMTEKCPNCDQGALVFFNVNKDQLK